MQIHMLRYPRYSTNFRACWSGFPYEYLFQNTMGKKCLSDEMENIINNIEQPDKRRALHSDNIFK